MRKQQTDRHILNLNRKCRLAEMAETKPDAKAREAFIHKAYECRNITEYMAEKYDIKGETSIGQKDLKKA